MIEVGTITALLNLAKFCYDIIKDLRTSRQVSEQERRQAIDALLEAARETKYYLEHVREKGKRKKVEEGKLSELWRVASRKVSPINDSLSGRLFTKSKYWEEPDKWSNADIDEARIRFKDIENELEKMRSK